MIPKETSKNHIDFYFFVNINYALLS